MPKLKTKKGAAKRFQCTATGRIKHRCSNRNHILTKKAVKRKLHLRANTLISKSDEKAVKNMLNVS